MLYSLKRVADEMAADIAKYKIIVDPVKRTVGNEVSVTILDPFTSGAKCRTTIRHYIRLAKNVEQAKERANQSSLF